jgi:hypothetical protein
MTEISAGGQVPANRTRSTITKIITPRGPTPFERISYEPYPWQAKMHSLVAKIKWLQVGRRGGKSRGALAEAVDVIDLARKTPCRTRAEPYLAKYADEVGLVPPILIWTVAPTKAQMRQIWTEMKAFLPPYWIRGREPGRAGGRGGSGWKEDELVVFLELRDQNGNWLPGSYRKTVTWELKSADNPEGLQTVGLDFLHITEAQDIKEAAWGKVLPTLDSPYRLGRAVVEGIPPVSRQHWFARNYRIAKDKPNKRRAAIHAEVFDNPDLSDDQIEEINEAKGGLTLEIWERLYLAKQQEGSGGFFHRIRDAAGKDGCVELTDPEPGRQYIGGLDIGRRSAATVLVIKDRQSRQSVSVVELLKTDWNLQMAAIGAAVRHWGLQEIIMDSTGLGGAIGEDVLMRELVNEGIPITGFNFTSAKKYQLFLDYAIALEQGTVSFPEHWLKLQAQLEDMEYRGTTQGGHIFKTASGGYDDWVDAECLALFGCEPARVGGEGYTLPRNIPGAAPLNVNGGRPRSRMIATWKRLKTQARVEAQERYEAGAVPDLIVDGEEVRL